MYDELIKALRGFEDYDGLDFLENRTYAQDIAREAADAIEEMSRQLAEYHSYDGFLLMHGCFVDLPEPPKEN